MCEAFPLFIVSTANMIIMLREKVQKKQNYEEFLQRERRPLKKKKAGFASFILILEGEIRILFSNIFHKII